MIKSIDNSSHKERDYAIDIVKFLAVLLIINSHADIMYPKLRILATGGAIGDCLFLFCSGFTLLWGGVKSFDNYYKQRICRIYPSVFMSVAFIHIITMNGEIGWKELICTKPFIVAIMVYYVLLYFVQRYAFDRLKEILWCVVFVSLVAYIFWFPNKYEVSNEGLYGHLTFYRWIPYFAAMLLGAYTGIKRKELKYNGWKDLMMLMLCLILFYSIQVVAKFYRPIAPLQVVSLLPLMAIPVYFYKCCNCNWMKRIYQRKWGNIVIMAVGGLCLESYLIQLSLFTDKMNNIWPLNLVIITVIILFFSYIVRCMARWFSQTFRTEGYEWKKIISIY